MREENNRWDDRNNGIFNSIVNSTVLIQDFASRILISAQDGGIWK